MLKSLNTAATGMVAQQFEIDNIANNMANASTTGFKKTRAEFQDLLYQNIRTPGGQTSDGGTLPTGIQVGQGVRTASTQKMHMQGGLTQTSNSLDLAIEGQGFFQIRKPNGELAYTRAGNFKTNAQGLVVTVDGYNLEPNLVVPNDTTSMSISAEGTVSVVTAGQTESQEIGQIQLATFSNAAGLNSVGRGLYLPTSASGEPVIAQPGSEGLGSVAQGFLENSNVEIVTEMLGLISAQRAYEINNRVIQAADEMLRNITQR